MIRFLFSVESVQQKKKTISNRTEVIVCVLFETFIFKVTVWIEYCLAFNVRGSLFNSRCGLRIFPKMYATKSYCSHVKRMSHQKKLILFNLVVTVSRVGRFTITGQPCSDALQDSNSPESAQLSSIVVSGVSVITT